MRRSLFPDLEHLGAAVRAGALGRRLAVLHRDGRRALHFLLGLTLHAIRFHCLFSIHLGHPGHLSFPGCWVISAVVTVRHVIRLPLPDMASDMVLHLPDQPHPLNLISPTPRHIL